MAQLAARRKMKATGDLRRYAREMRLKRPSERVVFELLEQYDDAWDYDESAERATKDVCDDYLAMAQEPTSSFEDMEAGSVSSRSSTGFAHYLASVVRPYAEAFRMQVWGAPRPPFTNKQDAATWIDETNRLEPSNGTHYEFIGDFPDALHAFRVWDVTEGGLLDKLRRLCERVSDRYPQWTPEQVLTFVLIGTYPLLHPHWKSRKSPGSGGRVITITLRSPATEGEVLEAYREALSAQGIAQAPKPLSLNKEMLLRLVYSTPGASWSERLARWKAYRAHYGDQLKDYPGEGEGRGRQSMFRDFRRAEERATWSGDIKEERCDLGLYTSLPEMLPAAKAKIAPNVLFGFNTLTGEIFDTPTQSPAPKMTYEPYPIDLEPFARTAADAPLGLSREDAQAIVRHKRSGTADPDDYHKFAHLCDRIEAIANDDILRPQDR